MALLRESAALWPLIDYFPVPLIPRDESRVHSADYSVSGDRARKAKSGGLWLQAAAVI